jgi:hypothetical protein
MDSLLTYDLKPGRLSTTQRSLSDWRGNQTHSNYSRILASAIRKPLFESLQYVCKTTFHVAEEQAPQDECHYRIERHYR